MPWQEYFHRNGPPMSESCSRESAVANTPGKRPDTVRCSALPRAAFPLDFLGERFTLILSGRV